MLKEDTKIVRKETNAAEADIYQAQGASGEGNFSQKCIAVYFLKIIPILSGHRQWVRKVLCSQVRDQEFSKQSSPGAGL